jgi:hypothetical protein
VIDKKQMKIKQITKISTICEILNSYDIDKQMFKEFDKLTKLCLTVPVNTARAERAFSALYRLNSVPRSLKIPGTRTDGSGPVPISKN